MALFCVNSKIDCCPAFFPHCERDTVSAPTILQTINGNKEIPAPLQDLVVFLGDAYDKAKHIPAFLLSQCPNENCIISREILLKMVSAHFHPSLLIGCHS